MNQSFITPRPKKVLSAELTWILSGFGVLVVIMLGSTLFLNSSITIQKENLAEVQSRLATIAVEKERVLSEVQRLQILEKMREKISTKNRLQKENVQNFFDLVPDGVVLELAEFRENTLRLKGTTRTKQQFNNTFQRSLNSLFSSSSTRFKRLENGRYRFENISTLEVTNE